MYHHPSIRSIILKEKKKKSSIHTSDSYVEATFSRKIGIQIRRISFIWKAFPLTDSCHKNTSERKIARPWLTLIAEFALNFPGKSSNGERDTSSRARGHWSSVEVAKSINFHESTSVYLSARTLEPADILSECIQYSHEFAAESERLRRARPRRMVNYRPHHHHHHHWAPQIYILSVYTCEAKRLNVCIFN